MEHINIYTKTFFPFSLLHFFFYIYITFSILLRSLLKAQTHLRLGGWLCFAILKEQRDRLVKGKEKTEGETKVK